MFQYKINDALSLTLVHSSFASQMNDIVNAQKTIWVNGYRGRMILVKIVIVNLSNLPYINMPMTKPFILILFMMIKLSER